MLSVLKVSFKDRPPSPQNYKNSTVFVAPSLLHIQNRLSKLALSEELGDVAFLEISTHLSPTGE